MADDLADRLIALFRPARTAAGRLRRRRALPDGPAWRDHLLFYEYFHGDTGAGLGASHQTGWTALVADLIIGRGRT